MPAQTRKSAKIDLKNQAETLVYQAEKQMGELGDKVDADAKAKVEEKRTKLKEATEKEDYDAMKTLLENCSRSSTPWVRPSISRKVQQLALELLVLTPVPTLRLVPLVRQPMTSLMLNSPNPSEHLLLIGDSNGGRRPPFFMPHAGRIPPIQRWLASTEHRCGNGRWPG